jgi:hypothetical protein
MFFKLRNSESAVDKKMSEGLKRREVFYALVQIIKDPQNRDLEGQVKIMKFGYKIKTKIDEELNPQFDEPTQVFDPFEGKNFELVISKKGGFPNYDSSKFHGNKSPMTINGEAVSDDDASRKSILDLLGTAPDLTTWGYKAWDDVIRGKVMNVLSQFTSPGDSISNITAPKPAPSTPKVTEAAATKATTETETTTAEPTKGEEKKDDFDDFINGLDL